VLQSEREKGWRLEAEGKISNVKLPAHKAGLAGHLPVKVQSWESLENWKNELRAKGVLGNSLFIFNKNSVKCSQSRSETPEKVIYSSNFRFV
jgi:hypothetical protein